MLRTLVITVTTLALAASTAPGAAAKDEGGTLDAAAQAWLAAYQSGDAAAVAKIYSEDGMLLPPQAETVKGREGIATMWKSLMESGAKLVLENLETGVEGKLGYRMGTFTMLGPDGKEVDRGKYIEIWKREGKDWVLARDIWNSSLPTSMH